MSHRCPFKTLVSALLVAQALCSAYAQENDTDPAANLHSKNVVERQGSELSEVIVTAQKIRQRELDVPISLAVLTAQQLEQRGITSLTQLQSDVPGLYVEGDDIEHRVVLRGVSNVYGTGSLVSEYVDEADATAEGATGGAGLSTFAPSLYDLERVEVLRGPQGTLYGDGAMGGTIRFITNEPVLDEFQMKANVAVMFTPDGAPSQRTEAMVNAPVLTNVLGLRFAGNFEHEGGWIDQPAADLKNINSSNLVDTRIEGLWQPTRDFSVRAMQLTQRSALGDNMGEDSKGNYTQVFGITTSPKSELNSNLSNVTMTYDLASIRLLSSSTYSTTSNAIRNLGETAFKLVSGVPITTLDELLTYDSSAESFSQETRLSNTGGGSWQWMLGGFYKHYNEGFDIPLEYFGVPGPLPKVGIHNAFYAKSLGTSWSGFANTSYKLTHRLTVGAGVRYFRGSVSYNTTGSAFQEGTFTSSDPRFYIQYKWTENVNTYASAAKGFRSGGFNSYGEPSYGPEVLWTYELGAKLRLLENRARVNVDVFDSEYSKYVSTAPFFLSASGNSPVTLYLNAGKARIKGVEAELGWRSESGWSFSVNGDYLDDKFLAVNPISGFSVGDALPLVSKYMFTGALSRLFSWGGKLAYVGIEYSETSPMQYGPDNKREYSDLIRTVNFDSNIQWTDQLKFGLFAHNLTNGRGLLDPYADLNIAGRQQPRTFGIEFSVAFK